MKTTIGLLHSKVEKSADRPAGLSAGRPSAGHLRRLVYVVTSAVDPDLRGELGVLDCRTA